MNTQQIPVNQIDPNPHQVRAEIDDSNIDELMNSIREVGIIQPLLVTCRKDRYILIAGHRRFEAARRTRKLTIFNE